MTKSAQVATWTAQSEQLGKRVGELEGERDNLYEALKAFMQLPHLFDDVCDRGTDCRVCKAIVMGTDALAKTDAARSSSEARAEEQGGS
jgi:hypothetical protein